MCGVEIHSQYVEDNEEYSYKEGEWAHKFQIKKGFLEKDNDLFSSKNEEIRKNSITLVQYLGNGKFLDYRKYDSTNEQHLFY